MTHTISGSSYQIKDATGKVVASSAGSSAGEGQPEESLPPTVGHDDQLVEQDHPNALWQWNIAKDAVDNGSVLNPDEYGYQGRLSGNSIVKKNGWYWVTTGKNITAIMPAKDQSFRQGTITLLDGGNRAIAFCTANASKNEFWSLVAKVPHEGKIIVTTNSGSGDTEASVDLTD